MQALATRREETRKRRAAEAQLGGVGGGDAGAMTTKRSEPPREIIALVSGDTVVEQASRLAVGKVNAPAEVAAPRRIGFVSLGAKHRRLVARKQARYALF